MQVITHFLLQLSLSLMECFKGKLQSKQKEGKTKIQPKFHTNCKNGAKYLQFARANFFC